MIMAPSSNVPGYLSAATAAVLGSVLQAIRRRRFSAGAGRRLGLEFIIVALVSWAVGCCATAFAQSVDSPPSRMAATAQDAPSADGVSYCGRRLGAWFYCDPPVAEPAPTALEQPVKVVVPPEIVELEA